MLTSVTFKDLLTECEVFATTLDISPELPALAQLSPELRRIVTFKKTEGITFPLSRTDRANEVNKGFIIWLC